MKNAIARKNAICAIRNSALSVRSSCSTTITTAISAMIRNPRRVGFISRKAFTRISVAPASGLPADVARYRRGERDVVLLRGGASLLSLARGLPQVAEHLLEVQLHRAPLPLGVLDL